MQGFLHGFSLHYEGPRAAFVCGNLKSALQNPQVVQEKLNKEILAGRVAGPFDNPPMENLRISPIGLVPKKSSGDFRLIHHLSYPSGESVNDYIDPQICSVRYTSFDEAVFLIQDLGPNCKLFKMDLKNAFRILPVHPHDYELLGFSFMEKFFVDKALPFGCSISCSSFEKFATFLEFCVRQRLQSRKLIHYLDNFFGGDKTVTGCSNAMTCFTTVMQELNVPLTDEKTEGPSEIIVFLGLELDSNAMVVRIPREKITEVIEKIEQIIACKKATLKKLQSLIGSLNFCCRAIAVGRPFCRRLINATCGAARPFHRIRVSKNMKLDLQLWLEFFKHSNGISVFHDRFWVTNSDEELYR